MKISINCIIHDRYLYIKSFINEIIKISANIKNNLTVNLLVSSTTRDWKTDKQLLSNNNIKCNVFYIPGGDYMAKIRTAIENTGEYAIKLDEDIFIPSQVWEYFLSNLHVLDDPKNLFISPLLSTGIPTVDVFVEQFLTTEQRDQLYKIYLETRLPSIWGADYSKLEQHTIKAQSWNSENFYKEVDKIEHHYRGVHPVRFSPVAQNFINKCVKNNFNKILQTSNFSLFTDKKPYFCNSVFGIRKDVWLNILNDASLFKDTFEEVPLNLYMKNNNLNMVFINNGFGVHPSYNTINVFGTNYKTISDSFFDHDYFK